MAADTISGYISALGGIVFEQPPMLRRAAIMAGPLPRSRSLRTLALEVLRHRGAPGFIVDAADGRSEVGQHECFDACFLGNATDIFGGCGDAFYGP